MMLRGAANDSTGPFVGYFSHQDIAEAGRPGPDDGFVLSVLEVS